MKTFIKFYIVIGIIWAFVSVGTDTPDLWKERLVTGVTWPLGIYEEYLEDNPTVQELEEKAGEFLEGTKNKAKEVAPKPPTDNESILRGN